MSQFESAWITVSSCQLEVGLVGGARRGGFAFDISTVGRDPSAIHSSSPTEDRSRGLAVPPSSSINRHCRAASCSGCSAGYPRDAPANVCRSRWSPNCLPSSCTTSSSLPFPRPRASPRPARSSTRSTRSRSSTEPGPRSHEKISSASSHSLPDNRSSSSSSRPGRSCPIHGARGWRETARGPSCSGAADGSRTSQGRA